MGSFGALGVWGLRSVADLSIGIFAGCNVFIIASLVSTAAIRILERLGWSPSRAFITLIDVSTVVALSAALPFVGIAASPAFLVFSVVMVLALRMLVYPPTWIREIR
jgi:hypothetical protein